MPFPSVSAKAYLDALRALQHSISDSDKQLLRALLETERSEMTTEEIARAAGAKARQVVHSQLGRIAHSIAREVGAGNWQGDWTFALAVGAGEVNEAWQWRIKPAFARALRSFLSDGQATRNPDWTRDELIIALDFYVRCKGQPPSKGSREIRDLSVLMNRIGQRLGGNHDATFRNANGVYMKLMNFRRFDPAFTQAGKKGLSRGNRDEQIVWKTFANDPTRLARTAEAIRAAVETATDEGSTLADLNDGTVEAEEGRELSVKHLRRERCKKLVEKRKASALRKLGRLECEACGFDFAARYGERGEGFIECHHKRPLADGATRTKLEDLALVCANCHRMIHASRHWLSMEELKLIVRSSQ